MDLQDWMSLLPEQLWDTPLTHLAIPGSHDTMTYNLDLTSPLLMSEPESLRRLDRFCCCFTRPIIYRWATTQDKTIEEQLSIGIRYFDLRIAHKPDDKTTNLYFTHAIYTCDVVLDTLASLAAWLDSHPKEIVILACSHFEGMDDKLHLSFIRSLQELFGSKICPRQGSSLTLRGLWSSGHQVIISYEAQIAYQYQDLWLDIPYWWADRLTAEELISYMESKKRAGRPRSFFVAGLNLTADQDYITMHLLQSVRTLTYAEWPSLRDWVEQQTPGSDPQSLNIIAGDFVGPLPLSRLVIDLNHKLLQKNSDQMEQQSFPANVNMKQLI
ncbi:PI-PLC X domain-containing protein 1-like [Neosynchiropus ocellatus]